MKIGVVVHGPEIVDSGYALKIINLLKNFGEVKAKLGGTMGRVAVIDNDLTDIIDISEKLLPSEALKKLAKDCDILILMNYGKSKITGHTFGKIVIERANVEKPIIQIERPGEKDGTIIIWRNSDYAEKIAKYLAEKLKLMIEKCISNGLSCWIDKGRVYRKVHGVDVGEAIMVNGIVIGKAKSRDVILVAEGGRIVDIIGGELKLEGLERLKEIDLEKAIIKTGILRRNPKKIKVKDNKINEGYVKIINHCGEDVLKYINNELLAIITIGDDTTTICGDILARFGIRVIGVVDGDIDGILKDPKFTKGSIIFYIKNVRDDIAGEIIENNLDFSKKYSWDEIIKKVKEIFEKNHIKYSIQKL
ncbi:DUF2117 domain-containing protein [Methanocaldococcus villosus]|uniref:DUF2117 domain-containing protein n=1 Tax=Methanocaldococcus villosus TaxID=667126 RepID=UPI000363CAA9|nr:DUF2117 domain-containing protein [Methanocaldococcus villosus]